MPPRSAPAAGAPTSGAPALPWVDTRRRSTLRDLAAPLLLAALRRMVALPMPERTLCWAKGEGWEVDLGLCGRDTAVLDRGRPTRNRLIHAASWDAAHPHGPRPFLHNLRHTGYVLRALGLTPSAVHRTRCALRIPTEASDEDLLALAHLSVVSAFAPESLVTLHESHGWSLHDLLAWSVSYDEAHFDACVAAGFDAGELGRLVAAGTIPDPGQVELLTAFALPAPEFVTDYATTG